MKKLKSMKDIKHFMEKLSDEETYSLISKMTVKDIGNLVQMNKKNGEAARAYVVMIGERDCEIKKLKKRIIDLESALI